MSAARQSEGRLLRAAVRLGDPAAGLTAVAALRQKLDVWEAAHVDEAIAAGWSWQRVAEQLGVTKQAAHARHAHRTRAQAGLVVAGRAREAVQRAREDAARLGARSVETDHLLLALLAEREGSPVHSALHGCGITVELVRDEALAAEDGSHRPPGQAPPVSPSTREVLEQSMREAVGRGDARLDVEHLLFAILHEVGGRGQQAVQACGSSPGGVERRLARALRDQASGTEPQPESGSASPSSSPSLAS